MAYATACVSIRQHASACVTLNLQARECDELRHVAQRLNSSRLFAVTKKVPQKATDAPQLSAFALLY
jgi:hypothetical protein